VCQVLVPLLPALQQHMAMALNAIKQPPQGGLDVLFEGGQTHNCHAPLVLQIGCMALC
jgi:hypothetical protein